MRGLVLAALGAAILCFTGGCDDGGGAAPTAPSVPLLTLTFTPMASGLTSPTAIAHAGDGSGRLFVVEQGGQVRILPWLPGLPGVGPSQAPVFQQKTSQK
jgi:hypothetical protein